MSLRSSCTICTDYFSAEKDISATFCGHLFHADCLNRWFKTCGSHRSCPQCRTKITAKQVVGKIYLNIREDDVTELDPCSLKNKLDEAELKAVKIKKEKSDLESALGAVSKERDKLAARIKSLKNDLTHTKNVLNLLRTEIDVLKSDAADGRSARTEMVRLRERVKVMERIEVMLEGQKSEVDAMLSQYTQESCSNEATKRLATLCVSLKQEYENLKTSKRKIEIENMRLRKEVYRAEQKLSSDEAQIEALEGAVADLRETESSLASRNEGLIKKLTALERAIASPSDSRSSAVSRLIAESPAPLFLTPFSKPAKRVSGGNDGSAEIKKPRLSISFDENDDSANIENSPSVDSPSTSRIKKHFDKVKVVKTGFPRPNPAAFPKNNSLLSKNSGNKKVSGLLFYDGMGETKRRALQPTPKNKPPNNAQIKFSSSNNKLKDANRFARLKRLGPK